MLVNLSSKYALSQVIQLHANVYATTLYYAPREGRVSSASSSTNQPVVIQNVKCKVFTFDHSSIKRPATYPNPDTNRPVQKKQGSISSFVKRCGAESKSGESDGQTIDEYMQ